MHGSTARVYCDAYDLTPFMTAAEANQASNVVDTTGFGMTATTHVVDPAKIGTLKASGYSAFNATGITGGTTHAALTAAIGSNNHFAALCFPDVVGSPAAAGYGIVNDFKYESATNNVTDASFDFTDNDGLDWATVLHAGTTVETAAGNGGTTTGKYDSGASSALGGVIYLMVLSETGTSITVKLQDSPDNITYTDVASGAFSAVTAANAGSFTGCQRLVLPAATINRYVRAAWTGTFNPCQFLMLFKRY